MTTVSYHALADAFNFVSVDGMIEAHAYIAKTRARSTGYLTTKTSVTNYRQTWTTKIGTYAFHTNVSSISAPCW